MTDEEWLFKQTEIERKKLGYGDKNKKRGGGKTVKLPSDYLTKKEREALNGECKTYKKKDFYTWDEFKALPSDLQVAWVNSIINRYDVGLTVISQDILGMSKNALNMHFSKSGEKQYINKPQTGAAASRGRKKLAEAFALWKNTQITMCEEDLPANDPDPAEIEENQPESEALPESPAPATNDLIMPPPPIHLKPGDLSNVGILIQSLIGSGAKLTIEVTL